MKILLINPLFTYNHTGVKQYPLGLAYIHAAIRNICEVEIYDLSFENQNEKLVEKLLSCNYDLIGITVYESIFYNIIKIIDLIKRISIHSIIVIGGHFASYACKDILEIYNEIDYIILGEGEEPFSQLIEALGTNTGKDISKIKGIAYKKENHIHINEQVDIDVNKYPIPSWDVLLLNSYNEYDVNNQRLYTPICTSRGCFGRCSFCSIKKHQGKTIRNRDIKNVEEEINLLISRYNVSYIYFSEPNFFASSKRANEMLKMLSGIKGLQEFGITTRVDSFLKCKDLHESLFASGCKSIELGIESGSDKQLTRLKKGTSVEMNKEAIHIINTYKNTFKDVGLFIDMIMFDPYSKVEEVMDSYHFLIDNNLCFSQNEHCLFSIMHLFHGTEMRETAIKDQLANLTLENVYYNFADNKTAEFYSYIFIFQKLCMNQYELINTRILNLLNSKIYKSKVYGAENNKILRMYVKRNKICFNFFRELYSVFTEKSKALSLIGQYKNRANLFETELKNFEILYLEV